TIGGMEYANAVRGDGQQATQPIAAAQQRAALTLLLSALAPKELAIPDTVLTLMAPGATNITPPVELFGSRTRPAFDELGAARTLAQMVVDGILQRDRAARLAQFTAHGSAFTLGTVIDGLVNATCRAPAPASPKLAALQRVTQRAVVDRLLLLAADSEAAPEVRAMADLKLAELRPSAAVWSKTAGRSEEDRAHWLAIATDVGQWIEKRQLPSLTRALVAPPGDPF
ncbi:MAG TPA: zinc-dependent metalloprotease, partial [Gemmatimonadaceae bacterium]|nr:zinc-dependent metalloprotease [Gemmatimonadaceae bacterium]